MSNWYDNAVVYHIYPLGYCGKLAANEFRPPADSPILRVIKHIPEIKRLGFNTVFFGPVFESTKHGYDTADYTKIDSRLGTNSDFARVCSTLHDNGIRVILDGVFNHVGRNFWAFSDVKEKKFGSQYKDWFYVRDGNSNYNDGFWYEGWEGHFELVKLNLQNPAVKNHIFDAVTKWREEFGIDGLRLDVAYCLDHGFLRELRRHCKGLLPDFWLMGETLHGDYNVWMNPEMLDSVTNYQAYKGLYSSFNDLNMFEIAHTFRDHFESKYRGKNMYSFVDNHDVGRIASVLKNEKHLIGLHALLFTMPGVPGVYYGSEYGFRAAKSDGDDALRPEFDVSAQKETELTQAIQKLAKAHSALQPLYAGDYRQLVLNNRYFAFARHLGDDIVYTLINADDKENSFNLGGSGSFADVLTGKIYDISGEIRMPAYSASVLFRAGGIAGNTLPGVTQAAEPERAAETAAPVQQNTEVIAKLKQAFDILTALADELGVKLDDLKGNSS